MSHILETKLDRCVEWLKNYLRNKGQASVKKIVEDAKAAGYGRALLFRAYLLIRDEHIQNTLGYRAPNNEWKWVE